MSRKSSPELRHLLNNIEIAIQSYQTVIQKASMAWKETTEIYLENQLKLTEGDHYLGKPVGFNHTYSRFKLWLEEGNKDEHRYAYFKAFMHGKSYGYWNSENNKMSSAGAKEFALMRQNKTALETDLFMAAYLEALYGLGPDILKKAIKESSDRLGLDVDQEIAEAGNSIRASQMLLNHHLQEPKTDYHPVVMNIAY